MTNDRDRHVKQVLQTYTIFQQNRLHLGNATSKVDPINKSPLILLIMSTIKLL